MIRILLILATFSVVHAQSPGRLGQSPSPMDQVDMSNLKRPIKLPVPHIHTMTEKRNAGPDRIFGQTGKTYYACIGGQEVCNLSGGDHGVRIPQSMTDEFDAHMVEFRQRQNALRQELAATGRSTVSVRATPVELSLGSC